MKLKELNAELSCSNGQRKRSIHLGPFNAELNFVYGERGAGKSTLRHQLADLLAHKNQHEVSNSLPNCSEISIVAEQGTQQFRIARSADGRHSSERISAASNYNSYQPVATTLNVTSASPLPQLNHDVVDNIACPSFSNSAARLPKLYRTLQSHFSVPVGSKAVVDDSSNVAQAQQRRFELQRRIESLREELAALQAERLTLSNEVERQRSLNQSRSQEIETQIRLLTARLAELDPARIRMEIEATETEIARLHLEIQQATVVVTENGNTAQTPYTPYLPTLYRLLDEVEQHAREIRDVQSNVQQHRVRLKNEMELWNQLTLEQQNHPYHRTRELLRLIEGRVDQIETNSHQWVDDHGTVDTQQVSRFLDESCRAIREDLDLLCDELSDRYREIRHRSATQDLKELRHNYNQISDVTRHTLDRRAAILDELRVADPQGAAAIENASPEFAHTAATDGNLAARQRYVGQLPAETRAATSFSQTTIASEDSQRLQQRLVACESRLSTLQSSLLSSQAESEIVTRQITELSLQKEPSISLLETQSQSRLSQMDARRFAIEAELNQLTLELSQISIEVHVPNPLLVSAGNILVHLTGGMLSQVWLDEHKEEFVARDRLGNATHVNLLPERGIAQLVQLALVLAANEAPTAHALPVVLDDLFAESENKRIDAMLETLARWCKESQRQVIVLTQHRFLADRIPGTTVLELEADSLAESWRPVTSDALTMPLATADRQQPHARSWYPIATAVPAQPVAEYPRSPLPRPYPLSKYPRTADRARNDALHHDSFSMHEQLETAEPQSVRNERVATRASQITVGVSARATTSVSAADVGDPFSIVSITAETSMETVDLFDASQLRCLDDHDIFQVNDFLEIDPADTPADFATCYLSGESLSDLQAAIWLMMWVPGLSSASSQALVACGISDPSHLLTSNADSLYERLSRFLRSPDGRRFNSDRNAFTRATVSTWQNQLRSNRRYRNQRRPNRRSWSGSRSRNHSLRAYAPQDNGNVHGDESRSRQNRSEQNNRDRDRNYRERSHGNMPVRSARMQPPAERYERDQRDEQFERSDRDSRAERGERSSERSGRESRPARQERFVAPIPPREPRSSRKESSRKPDAVRQTPDRQAMTSRTIESNSSAASNSSDAIKLKFYLDLSDHIEAAPSIGPKTAERFEAIGVVTVADFLKQTAESLAEKLNYKRLNAKLLRQWQHQTRLVCRIPNLRGHDAQLLVGCGIVDAEELATMRPEMLFQKIGPFSDTKEGLKIIRNGKKPDLEEITDWISFAQHTRSIQAA